MNYTSTRSKIKPISSAEAILRGLSDDGGLFVPEKFPKVTLDEISSLEDKTDIIGLVKTTSNKNPR